MAGHVFRQLAEDQCVQPLFVQPGKSDQNAFAERLNRTFRQEFALMWEVEQIWNHWRKEYNKERPHESLNNLPPSVYMPREIQLA